MSRIKKLLALALALALMAGLGGTASAAAEEEKPLEIYTLQDLRDLVEGNNGIDPRTQSAVLMNDLDLSEWDIETHYYYFFFPYNGVFDGNGHTLSNMKLWPGREMGFFCEIGPEGVVKNLTLSNVNVDVTATGYNECLGCVAGYNQGLIENCAATGSIRMENGWRVGGIVGNHGTDAIVKDCVSEVDIQLVARDTPSTFNAHIDVGGIAGTAFGLVDNCVNRGDVSYTGVVNYCSSTVGGIVGECFDSTVRNCVNLGNVAADAEFIGENGIYACGLVGRDISSETDGKLDCDNSKLLNSYNAGDVTLRWRAREGSAEDGYFTTANPFWVHWTSPMAYPVTNCLNTGRITIESGGNAYSYWGPQNERCYCLEGTGNLGESVPQSALTDGTVLQKLNEYVYSNPGQGLRQWVMTGEGPMLGEVPKTTFSDVKPGDYFYDPVQWAIEREITSGTGNGTFSPKAPCTQAQILTFLWRADGMKHEMDVGEIPYLWETVFSWDYFFYAATWSWKNGIYTADTFQPDAPCTRGDAMLYLWRCAGSPEWTGTAFSDIEPGTELAQAAGWASEKGIANGVGDGKFAPGQACNRGDIATFLYRARDILA